MANEVKPVPVKPKELEERLNYLEYVVENTKKVAAPFKNGPLKSQTEDFLELVEAFKDAIGTYRDEILDQGDME
jgi:hypothetical protein